MRRPVMPGCRPVTHRHAMVRAGNRKMRRRTGASGDPGLRLLRKQLFMSLGTPGNNEKGHQSPPFFKGGQGGFQWVARILVIRGAKRQEVRLMATRGAWSGREPGVMKELFRSSCSCPPGHPETMKRCGTPFSSFRPRAARGFWAGIQGLFFQSPWFCSLVRILLGGVFAIAGCAKLAAPRAFARIISAYGLVPEEFLVPVAVGLPAVELLAGLGLLFNVRGSLTVVCGLLTCFLFALGYAMRENLDVDCGCFSQMEIHDKKQPSCGFSEGPGINCRNVLSHSVATNPQSLRTEQQSEGGLSGAQPTKFFS